MPLFIIKLFLGGLGWLKQALSAAWDAIRRYPREAAIMGLCCLSGWLWHVIGNRNDTIAERDATIAQIIAAQKQAVAKQAAADKTNMAGQLAAIDTLEKNHAPLEEARRTGTIAYVDRLRKAAGGASCRAGAPSLPDNPGSPAATSDLPDTVAVPTLDIARFSEVELHDSEAVTFLNGLVDQGLAIPASRVPRE
jgi:hypothetical protein